MYIYINMCILFFITVHTYIGLGRKKLKTTTGKLSQVKAQATSNIHI